MREEFFNCLAEDQRIAAIHSPKKLDQFLRTNLRIAFLMTGNISVIKRYVDVLKKHNRLVFLHLEKIAGISYDKEGIKFIAKLVQPTGIISTKGSLIQLAKKEGLLTIQRLFLVDTEAMNHGINLVDVCQPDVVEIMPALMPDMIQKVVHKTNVPIITGGLVYEEKHLVAALHSGAQAVSTGDDSFWKSQNKLLVRNNARKHYE
ncbi:glycerol-3-phosphate responsive antiterminator [Bacillus sp. DX4.1]|uniref:glycerol-3-phosphate responsive antiterminator n=1 Tax=Bacillus sp. DX4.1 TaxID=3055867 RepID=UPI0025A195F4|nr:glycerol-3-phosphate responsive antiterminator [Bacillus sp. DX4.1]MDM5189311.1 glycerol-3-phosphate responsive antiterminator [Bacillus sp. DX4.1]